jgi:hypothetical protein
MRSRQFILIAIKKATISHSYRAKDARELILTLFFELFGRYWLAGYKGLAGGPDS